MNVEFVVNSNPIEFTNWLKLYIEGLEESHGLVTGISEDGFASYAATEIKNRDDFAGELRLNIRGKMFLAIGEDDDPTFVEPDRPPDDVFIGLTLTPLSSNRTEVKAGSVEEAWDFFLILLKFVAERYPEAADAINRHLENWHSTLHDSGVEVEPAIDEIRKILLSMGFSAEQIKNAIEEYRHEQYVIDLIKMDAKNATPQNLSGAYIAPSTTLFPPTLTKESDSSVVNKRLGRIEAMVELLVLSIERQSVAKEQQGDSSHPLVASTSPSERPKLTRKPPGRKPDQENEEAYRMILINGGTLAAADNAYEFWCTAKNITTPTTRDRENFNLAMKRASERAQRNKSPTQ